MTERSELARQLTVNILPDNPAIEQNSDHYGAIHAPREQHKADHKARGALTLSQYHADPVGALDLAAELGFVRIVDDAGETVMVIDRRSAVDEEEDTPRDYDPGEGRVCYFCRGFGDCWCGT